MKSGIAATGTRPALSSGAASSAALPRNDPRNRLPPSPMKIVAGPHVVDQEPERRADEGRDRQ